MLSVPKMDITESKDKVSEIAPKFLDVSDTTEKHNFLKNIDKTNALVFKVRANKKKMKRKLKLNSFLYLPSPQKHYRYYFPLSVYIYTQMIKQLNKKKILKNIPTTLNENKVFSVHKTFQVAKKQLLSRRRRRR